MSVQVAEFLQDSKLSLFTDACATQLIINRRNGFRAGPQLSLSHEIPTALLRDILQQLAHKSSLSAVLQQVSAAVRPDAAAACVQRRTLRLPDTFATPSELSLFLEHLPTHPCLLSELQLSTSAAPGLRLASEHRCISLLSTLLSTQSSLHTLDLSGVILPRTHLVTPLESAHLRLGPLHLPRSIRHLALSRCELSHHPIATLQRICASLRHLSYLDISHNALGVLGISALAPSLRNLSTLATLDISSNGIRKEGAVALAPHLATLTALTALHMASNVLQASGIAALTEALPALSLLATLDISGSVFSDSGALSISAILPRLPALRRLDLAWSALCDTGVSNLRPGLTAPRVHPPLEAHVVAHSSYITRDSQVPAAVPAGLTYLSLRNNNITSSATADLCVICVPLARTLQQLDLSCNRLRWGAGVLAGTLARLSELRTLQLRDTCMRTSDFTLLAPVIAGLKHLSHVDVSSNQLSTPLGVLLESIDRKVRECSGQTSSSLSVWGTGIVQVGQPGCHPGSVALAAAPVRTSKAVEMLHSSSQGVLSTQCRNMLAAGASSTSGGTSKSQVAVNSCITHLNLSCGFDADSGDATDLAGWDVPPVVHDLVREIVNRAVEDLAFGVNSGHSTQRAWRPPAISFPNLRFLDLSGTSDAFPSVSGLLLHCVGALESLNLSRVGLTASVARTLSQPLSECTRLTSLDISHNACMGAAGGSVLAEAVRSRMPALHVLSLAMCGVGGAVIAEACIVGCSSTVARWNWAAAPTRTVSDPGALPDVHAGCGVHARRTAVVTAGTQLRRVAMGCATDDTGASSSVHAAELAAGDAGSHSCMHGGECKGCAHCIPGAASAVDSSRPCMKDPDTVCTEKKNSTNSAEVVQTQPRPLSACVAPYVHSSANSTVSVEYHGSMHAPGSGNSTRRASAPTTAEPRHAACCAEYTGSCAASTSAPAVAAGKHGAQWMSGVGDNSGSCMHAQRSSQRRELLQLQSLNLKGVALGQTVGIAVLRELAVCAPRLRKLDAGGTQLGEGESVAAVRAALDSLTQVTMLGLSGLPL